MKEHPILFSGPMVRAILAGTKTQTRRVVKPQPVLPPDIDPAILPAAWEAGEIDVRCPYGVPGDRLYCRETWAPFDETAMRDRDPSMIFYRADDERQMETDGSWRPSIHMPRWASRITLEITDVRVERVREISEADAYAEGCNDDGHPYISPFGGRAVLNNYAALWNQINGARPGCAWADNPYVWCVSSRRVA